MPFLLFLPGVEAEAELGIESRVGEIDRRGLGEGIEAGTAGTAELKREEVLRH